MFQLDLFADRSPAPRKSALAVEELDLQGVFQRLADRCERPRYSYMVLNLIAQASAQTGSAGPYVAVGDRQVPIRDWLCDMLVPVAQRFPRRQAITDRVRRTLIENGEMPADKKAAALLIDEKVQERIRRSGLTNISRAVSELVRIGFVHRYYCGYRVDHLNRGAQRQAVYVLRDEVRAVLSGSRGLIG